MSAYLNEIRELKSSFQQFRLWKTQWDNHPSSISYDWRCVKFERTQQKLVPDVPGIYAFFIEPRIAGFQSHGYLMYIGQAGYNSNNTLRKRFQKYLHDKMELDRSSIYWLLNNWENYIYFYFTELDNQELDLKKIETTLLDTFLPPYSKRGFSVRISKILGAFQNG